MGAEEGGKGGHVIQPASKCYLHHLGAHRGGLLVRNVHQPHPLQVVDAHKLAAGEGRGVQHARDELESEDELVQHVGGRHACVHARVCAAKQER